MTSLGIGSARAAEKRVFERLRVREAWEQVVADSGKSSLYKGLGLYFEYARPMVQELQATIAERARIEEASLFARANC